MLNTRWGVILGFLFFSKCLWLIGDSDLVGSYWSRWWNGKISGTEWMRKTTQMKLKVMVRLQLVVQCMYLLVIMLIYPNAMQVLFNGSFCFLMLNWPTLFEVKIKPWMPHPTAGMMEVKGWTSCLMLDSSLGQWWCPLCILFSGPSVFSLIILASSYMMVHTNQDSLYWE